MFKIARQTRWYQWIHNHFYLISLVLLCTIGIIIRFGAFDAFGQSFYFVDVGRDYILAHHIITYGEFPLTGSDAYFGPQSNSPIYFYLLAGLLLLYDHIFWPGLVNVLLQTGLIIGMYFLARELFGRKTALIAAVFTTFLDAVVRVSVQMWQPNFMMLLLWATLYCVTIGHTRKQPRWLLLSSFFFGLAVIMHNSAVVLLPVYAVGVWFVLHQERYRCRYLCSVAGIFLGTVILQLLPLAWYYWIHRHSLETAVYLGSTYVRGPVTEQSWFELVINFFERTALFFAHLTEGLYDQVSILTYVTIGVFTIATIFYYKTEDDTRQKIVVSLLLASVLCVLLSLSFLYLFEHKSFPVRYFNAAYLPFIIVLSEIIRRVTTNVSHSNWLVVGIVTILVISGSPSAYSYAHNTYERVRSQKMQALYPVEYQWSDEVFVVHEKIMELSSLESDTKIINFDIKTFIMEGEDHYRKTFLWAPLQTLLPTKILRVDDTALRGYSPVVHPEHIFIQCVEISVQDCTSLFEVAYSEQYDIHEVIYRTPSRSILYASSTTTL